MRDKGSSLLQHLRDWREGRNTPSLDWIQVEVTSQCNASCVYCPRTVYRSAWLDRHMPLDTFKRLLPGFSKAGMVHLQGWGEPFLNDNFFQMVALAKKAHCKVGTTTNGMLLNDSLIEDIVESGIDVIAFSLAGTDERNDTIRKGTSFKRVLKNILRLQEEKRKRRVTAPSVNIAYMLLRSNWREIGTAVSLLQGLGIRQLVVTTLDFLASQDLEHEQITMKSQEDYRELTLLLDRCVSEGERGGLHVHYHLSAPAAPIPVHSCTENVQKALFIAADGAVSPCAFTNIPVSGGDYVSSGHVRPYTRLTFGNIKDTSLAALWQSRRYVAFRDSFFRGVHEHPCETCAKLYKST